MAILGVVALLFVAEPSALKKVPCTQVSYYAAHSTFVISAVWSTAVATIDAGSFLLLIPSEKSVVSQLQQHEAFCFVRKF